MKLTHVAGEGDCGKEDCPNIYTTNRGTILVQGYTATDHGLALPSGEGVVEIPLPIFQEAARALA
jgi:hypothetical protein